MASGEASGRIVLPKPSRIVDHVVDRLIELIVEGTLPPGSLIRQESLAKQLGISRTPTREAIQRLELEGLVIIGPSGTARVASYEPADALALMEVRELVDGLAARVLARSGMSARTAAELVDRVEAMSRAVKADDKRTFLTENARFHLAIVEATGHKGLQLNIPLVRITSQAIYLEHGHQPERHEKSAAEHREILEAVAAGDADRAEEAARAHIRNAAGFWLKDLNEEGSAPDSRLPA
jgi:GntR family transcriptional regulator, vanillate catabolism transcriptional regulator